MQHSRPWVLGPGRGKLGHGDLKQIPCYQPTHVLGEAKNYNTPLRAADDDVDEDRPAPTALITEPPQGGVVDAEASRTGLLHLVNTITAIS